MNICPFGFLSFIFVLLLACFNPSHGLIFGPLPNEYFQISLLRSTISHTHRSHTMPRYKYSPLPTGSCIIRVLVLLPDTHDTSSINCQLINYSLPLTGSCYLPYEALSYLSRMLGVDAVCINQQDNQEKGYQIRLMPTIYCKASYVIVWLGKAADHSDRALDTIRLAAKNTSSGCESTTPWGKETNTTAVLMLLQRPWFRRVWVLQEISAAQSILVMCGYFKINGITFVLGLTGLNLSYKGDAYSGLENIIRSITYLMRGAISRPGYVTQPHGMLSLGELIDMYHTWGATKKHDKIYALLGMSFDDSIKAALLPNYQLPWNILFERVITSILPGIHSLETWPDREIAVIQGRGYILGRIDSVDSDSSRYDRQCVQIFFNTSPRLFTVKMISAAPRKEKHMGGNVDIQIQQPLHAEGSFLRDILLVWDWEVSRANSGEQNQDAVPITDMNFGKKRPHDLALITEDIMMTATEAGAHGNRIMGFLFKKVGSNLPVSERVIRMVAGNIAWGSNIMGQLIKLLDHRDNNVLISEDVVKVAAGNTQFDGDVMRQLLQLSFERGHHLPISEDVVKIAAGNTVCGIDILLLLADLVHEKDDNLPISEDVVKVSAGNTGCGGLIMVLLLRLSDRMSDNPSHILEHTLKIAASNTGSSIPLLKDIPRIAAGNAGCGNDIRGSIGMLLTRRRRFERMAPSTLCWMSGMDEISE
ncbi:heterokaryon incompatibility protein-domain-containing protein [Aspergillus flavus]|uniref:Heterokaryon incompatibility protein-domain-containing protein n=1 Tax=Aspergillus flavus (strain ATCC 200026 / FGSC A1120 / IAM 13836 / NRRL 3357 / JCM 12722 / SRRC 167) TaxID=332952 RepID=A0A7U2R0P9_ASPFN|nr:heterokaryon incompatibility protein-domain-containing protein [Aspergillus flavus]